ncbi:MAG: hypothetical protein KGO96_10615 [Elusimicrobia bacterium]|nr:hypothetical protein [Elusimicrobiota bacterium]
MIFSSRMDGAMTATLDRLRDSYGLDVRYRRLPNGSNAVELMLAGELADNVYVDYVVNPSLAGGR